MQAETTERGLDLSATMEALRISGSAYAVSPSPGRVCRRAAKVSRMRCGTAHR